MVDIVDIVVVIVNEKWLFLVEEEGGVFFVLRVGKGFVE